MRAISIVSIILIGLSFVYSTNVVAQVQNKPLENASVPLPSNAVPQTPSQYNSNIVTNSVTVRTAKRKYTDINTFNAQNYQHVNESIEFVDGLGRPLQSVMRQTSPSTSPQDIVQLHAYDALGRESVQYLPYKSNSSSGSLKTNPFAEQQTYLQNIYPGEQVFYGLTEYEKSPIPTTSKSLAPGNSWAGSGVGVVSEKTINTSDLVIIWGIDESGNLNGNTSPENTAQYYASGQLYKSIITDEHGKKVIEYSDKEGKVILKKVQILNEPSETNYEGWLCTYYVYDDLGRLRFVIPPKAIPQVQPMESGDYYFMSETVVKELCFSYLYDHRGRMIVKKVPGADEVYMVYDKRDRMVFTQDGNMRDVQWLSTIYDDMNRPVMTGMLFSDLDRQTLQDYVNGLTGASSNYNVQGQSSTSIVGELFISLRQTGKTRYLASQFIEFEEGFESDSGAEFSAEITTASSGEAFNNDIAININPLPPSAEFYPLTITNYDDYEWTNKSYDASNNSKLDAGTNLHPETLPTPAAQSQIKIKTLVTGTRVKVLDGAEFSPNPNWLTSVNFYDENGRLIQQQKENYKGGQDIVTNLFDFSGKVLSSYLVHNTEGGTINTVKIATNYSYDFEGRLLEAWKIINDDQTKKVPVSRNAYDGMGQLISKELGRKKDVNGVYTNEPLEKLDYSYNIRGWLKGINENYAKNAGVGQETHWFGMQLSYDWGYASNQLNGNIAGSKWRSRGDNKQRSYGFTYDNANRILSSDFNQFNGSWNKADGINFSSVMGDGVNPLTAYDANGNILAMKQWGLKGVSSSVIDELSYNYFDGSSKLKNVIDNVNDPTTKLGDFRSSSRYIGMYGSKDNNSQDYDYDRNGNLIQDLNKDMELAFGPDYNEPAIRYNYMNLPVQINIASSGSFGGNNGGSIRYIYDASGTKLEKTVDEFSSSINGNQEKFTSTTYLGQFAYENDELKFFSHEEGRTRIIQQTPEDPLSFEYDYFIKDHLGNVRMVLTEELKQDKYDPASMEVAKAAYEEKVYSNLNNTRVSKPAGYPNDQYTDPNEKVAELRGTANKVGPAILLKVMAGDQFNFQVSSWYRLNGQQPGNSSNPLNDLILSLASGISPLSGGKMSSIELQAPAVLNPEVLDFLNSRTYNANKPKAGVNWILLDEQFNLVASNSGSEQVPDEAVYGNGGTNPAVYWHRKTDMPISKNGYLYIYVSNESDDVGVFFDNLQVTHIRGPLLEETHYYPFGLTMTGISSKALNGAAENKYKYSGNELQSKEFKDGNGLDFYDFNARVYDYQIGRFLQIDPIAAERNWLTPYNFVQNNPLLRIDPLGTFDFVSDADGNIRWDKDANSQETTKSGETYLGKTLKFEFNSTIDAETWDGPLGNIPAGDKLTTSIYVTGNENEKGELTSISARKHVEVGPTPTSPLDNGRDFYPGLGNDQNKFSVTAANGGANVSMEQHASVSKSEELGLSLMGYNIVNVAQKLDINISSQGNVTVSAATDVFPSATLKVNGTAIMQYKQPSFVGTHSLPVNGYTTPQIGPGGYVPARPIYNYSYKPAVWYKRL